MENAILRSLWGQINMEGAILVGSDQHGRCEPASLMGSDQHGRCKRSGSVAQSRSTRSWKPKHDQSSVITKWMGDCYMLDFAPALRFLRSQILCRLHKSPPDEAINRGPLCACACKEITYTRWRSCSPSQCSVNYRNAKIIQHALKVSCLECWSWTLSKRRRRACDNVKCNLCAVRSTQTTGMRDDVTLVGLDQHGREWTTQVQRFVYYYFLIG